MKNIFLDDIRIPKVSHNSDKGLGDSFSDSNKWIIIRDYFTFIDYIKNNFDNINLISFDHDLACYLDNKEYTGKDAMNFIIDYCIDNDKALPFWYVHSDNTVGRNNIISLAISYMDKFEKINISSFRNYHRGYYNNKFV
jgi:hypothetical protein